MHYACYASTVGSIISYGFCIGAIQEKTFLSIIIGWDHILIMIYHVRAKSSVRSTGMNGGGPM